MEDRLAKEQQTKVLTEIEQPLVPILARMEDQGITVRSEFLQDFSKSLSIEIERLETEIYELAGQKFLIGSPKQLGEILFDKMGLPGGQGVPYRAVENVRCHVPAPALKPLFIGATSEESSIPSKRRCQHCDSVAAADIKMMLLLGVWPKPTRFTTNR